jgi:tetratricopeptide (TPR) repeat protein
VRHPTLLIVATLLATGSGSVRAESSAPEAPPQEQRWVESQPPEGARGGPLRLEWDEALALERAGRLEEAALRYEAIAPQLPDQAEPRWRIARNWWRHGERMPTEAKAQRMEVFARADAAAEAGLEIDPDCAECMLWRVASMGRLATTQGVVKSAWQAPEMAELIDRAIELAPTHRDSSINSTMGNLYYTGAVFYRLVPDWFWLEWVLGVRGDRERSVAYARQAVAESSKRIDYAVELGASLLCLGTSRGDPATLEEGRRALRAAASLDRSLDTDSVDMEHAQVLFDEPERACGYSRDGWIELDAEALQGEKPEESDEATDAE